MPEGSVPYGPFSLPPCIRPAPFVSCPCGNSIEIGNDCTCRAGYLRFRQAQPKDHTQELCCESFCASDGQYIGFVGLTLQTFLFHTFRKKDRSDPEETVNHNHAQVRPFRTGRQQYRSQGKRGNFHHMFKGSQDRSIAQSGAPVIRIDYAQQTEARSKRARGITPVEQSAFKPIAPIRWGRRTRTTLPSKQ